MRKVHLQRLLTKCSGYILLTWREIITNIKRSWYSLRFCPDRGRCLKQQGHIWWRYIPCKRSNCASNVQSNVLLHSADLLQSRDTNCGWLMVMGNGRQVGGRSLWSIEIRDDSFDLHEICKYIHTHPLKPTCSYWIQNCSTACSLTVVSFGMPSRKSDTRVFF